MPCIGEGIEIKIMRTELIPRLSYSFQIGNSTPQPKNTQRKKYGLCSIIKLFV